jgi:N4-gp56 family major capsid protein
MADFTWEFSAPTGVYKNNSLSAKLREQSIVESKFMDFVRTEPGFGKKRGESQTITRADLLTQPTSAALSEHDRIPVDDFALSTTAITVGEYGRAVTFSHMSQLLSKFDPQDPIQKALRKQMTKALDRLAATVMKTTYLAYIPTSLTGGAFDESPLTITDVALVNLNIAHLGAIRDAFASTYIVDPYEGDDYIGLLSTKAMRGIKNDDDFETWKQYLREGDTLHNSEVGKVESIRCIEIKDTTCLSGTKGTGSVLGEGIIFGDDFCAMIEAETPEVRVQVNFGQDHGRVNSAAWYGVVGLGLVWPTTAAAGKVKGCWITSG